MAPKTVLKRESESGKGLRVRPATAVHPTPELVHWTADVIGQGEAGKINGVSVAAATWSPASTRSRQRAGHAWETCDGAGRRGVRHPASTSEVVGVPASTRRPSFTMLLRVSKWPIAGGIGYQWRSVTDALDRQHAVLPKRDLFKNAVR